MADDIVTRLNEMLDGPVPWSWSSPPPAFVIGREDIREALNEIERLRESVKELCDFVLWGSRLQRAWKPDVTDDIVTQLRDDPVFVDDELLRQAADEIERLRRLIDAVSDLHDLDHIDNPSCTQCGEWPCPTHLIVCAECKEARRG
jgi:hypothetical protein